MARSQKVVYEVTKLGTERKVTIRKAVRRGKGRALARTTVKPGEKLSDAFDRVTAKLDPGDRQE